MTASWASPTGNRRLLWGAWLWLALAAVLSVWAAVQAVQDWNRVRAQVLGQEIEETRRAAGQVAALMVRMEDQAAAVAGDLEREGGGTPGLQGLLEARLAGARVEVLALQVRLPGQTVALDARRGVPGVRSLQPGADQPEGPAGWSEPHLSQPEDVMVVDFARDLQLPAGRGQVRVEVSLEEVQKLLRHQLTQAQGYGYLLSGKGTYLADPKSDRVRSGRTAFQVAEEYHDPGRLAVAEAARAGRSAFARSFSGISRKPAWIILEPVHHGGWALAAVLLEEELPLMPTGWRQDLAWLITCLVLLGWAVVFLGFRGHRLEARSLQRISVGWSLLLIAGIGVVFRAAYLLPTRPMWEEIRIMEPLDLRDFEQRQRHLRANFMSAELQFIPTGVFLHTLEVTGPDLMKMTGQIWQIYPKGIPPRQRGVTLPESINGEVKLEHESEQAEGVVQLYSFKATVREELDRTDLYPLDRTRIRLRLWPKPIFHNLTLVPDLWGYSVLAPTARPGVDQEIELPGWDLTSTEFAYVKEAYNADFGIRDFAGHQENLELLYNVSLRRRFLNPFIAAFLPLVAVAGLLYILLLSVTRDPEKVKATGYNYLNLLRTVIALFFSLIVAQFNVRNRISTSGVLYLEWFYFVLYVLILLVSALALRFALGKGGWLHERDHDLPKLAFWPLLLGVYYGIALRFLV